MDNFRYIDTIRRPDGSLRSWEEHEVLSKYEDRCDRHCWDELVPAIEVIKDAERGRIQKSLQKKRKIL